VPAARPHRRVAIVAPLHNCIAIGIFVANIADVDSVASYTVRAFLERKRSRKRDNGRLCGGIRRQMTPAHCHVAAYHAERDDPTEMTLAHERQRGLHAVEDRAHIAVDHLPVLIDGRVVNVFDDHWAGAADEHVDAAECALRRRDKRSGLIRIGYIGCKSFTAPTRGAHSADCLIRSGSRQAIVCSDRIPTLGERNAHASHEAACTAGHERRALRCLRLFHRYSPLKSLTREGLPMWRKRPLALSSADC